ncbi:hypothetical protein EON82_25815 [bacterium]|nr:MAG: hypothetical protein EON82_25815 [bacterium]
MNLRQAAREMRAYARRLEAFDRRASERAESKSRKESGGLSSGGVPTSLLSKAVHRGGYGAPYGWGKQGWLGPRGKIPYGNPAVINAQTGGFRSQWDTRSTFHGWDLVNNASYAGFLFGGTSLMIPRPIDNLISARVARDLDSFIATALPRILPK